MARSTQEIYDAIIAGKESEPTLDGLEPVGSANFANLLSGLNSNSKVAIWRLLVFLFAAAANVLETLWDSFRSEIEATIAANRVGRLDWYVEQMKRFQNGDLLTDINGQPGYAVIDEAKQIVTQASARENGGYVFLKAAKGTAPSLSQLTATELANLQAYVNEIKIAGVNATVSSLAADTLTLTADVYYDAQRTPAEVLAEVQQAIEAYVLLLAEPFDGEFKTIRLVDAVQQVPGVADFVPQVLTGETAGGVQTQIDRSYVAAAGYMSFDANNSTLNLIAQ